MLARAGTELVEELKAKFPLLQTLRFRWEASGSSDTLPPAIALFAAMANPVIPGSTCVLVPSRQDVASFVTILTAFQAAVADFPGLLERYIKSFKIGERVRVLPTGRVYVFGGYLEYAGKQFFKLKFLGDEAASRTFPITEGVRLEKTNKQSPKGRGEALGAFQRSKLDFVIGTAAGGNNALLLNEVVLVTTQKSFVEFLEQVHVSTSENPGHEFLLSQVVPWGVVNPEGQIEFRNSAAASGAPLIAISSRPEYAAGYCRLNDKLTSRVIIDGASRLKDAQAIDDIFDYSKTLIIADHTDLDVLPEIQKRDCKVWKLPEEATDLVGDGAGLLEQFSEVFHRAAQFKMSVVECECEILDGIWRNVEAAGRILNNNESDDMVLKLVNIAYSRLLEVCSLVSQPEEADVRDFRDSIDVVVHDMQARAIFIPAEALGNLKTALEKIKESLDSRTTCVWSGKQTELLRLQKELVSRGERFVVIGYNNLAIKSASKLLADKMGGTEEVTSLSEYLSGDYVDCVVLTGWPRAKNFKKLADSYAARGIYALGYGVERSFFKGAVIKRERQLSRWDRSQESLAKITGLKTKLELEPAISPVQHDKSPAFAQAIDFEARLEKIRKGSAAPEIEAHETKKARYVGFLGSTYCYLTENHSVPKVTGILRGGRYGERAVRMATVKDLSLGDLVLFRVSADTDRDIIRFLAEQIAPPGDYEKMRALAESWKEALRAIGRTPEEIARALKKQGLTRTTQSIRGWLTDVIGPAEVEDLAVIARTARDRKLEKHLADVWTAIRATRGAHMTAGFKLSQLLIRELPNQIPELTEAETIVELALDTIPLGKVAIVEIEDIADTLDDRSYLEVNRLLYA